MGFFDRLLGKKAAATATPSWNTSPADATPAPAGDENRARLVAAREKLEAKEVPAALVIYHEVLAATGDRMDVLLTASADLGLNGCLRELVVLVGPRYDAGRHGPATGLNLLQAHLALGEAEAAQRVLDILFGLNRPELAERLHRFSNAIAELIQAGLKIPTQGFVWDGGEPPKLHTVSLSRPVWSYGLEAVAGVLPAKAINLRRVAFLPLALPGVADLNEQARQPETELGWLSRALPLWLAETFYFSPHYQPSATVGLIGLPGGGGHYALLPTEWAADSIREMAEAAREQIDYVFTGALRFAGGNYELVLRVWEVKKFRQRKQFAARWVPGRGDAELMKLHESICQFMEWTAYPKGEGVGYVPSIQPGAWLETLAAALTLLVGERGFLPSAQLSRALGALETVAKHATDDEAAALAWLALSDRALRLGLPREMLPPAKIISTPVVEQALARLGR